MDKIDKILHNVLKQITPTPDEKKHTKETVKKILSASEEIARKHDLTTILSGSFLRDTWMRDKKEFDVFIAFPESVPRDELEKKGLDIGKKIVEKTKGTYIIAYAEHPYVRAKLYGYDVDIVPCYKVKDAGNIKSAVDRTPFHNTWLSKNFYKKQAPEVRLLKKFLKCTSLYGSDTKVLGFSGYLCELLIVKYSSFKNLVFKASKWKPGKVFIDIEKHHRNPEKISKKFEYQPLIVIDPVDSNRNVSAVLSPENFIRFVDMCRKFVKSPSGRFFRKNLVKIELKKIQKIIETRETRIITVEFEHPNVISDVLYPQLRKTAKRLKDILEEYEFKVLGYDAWSDDEKYCRILLELEVWNLPAVRKLIGPSIFIKKRSQQFLSKYYSGRIWVENDYWVAEVNRRFKKAEDKLKDSLSDNLSELKAKGVPSYVAKSIAKNFKLLDKKNILKMAENPGFFDFLISYFERQIEYSA